MIVDETGSMSNMKQATIESYNTWVAAQKKPLDGEDTFPQLSLIKFDTTLDVMNFADVSKTANLTDESYKPYGSTAWLWF